MVLELLSDNYFNKKRFNVGYEIVFFYKVEIEKGIYADEVLTKKVKIGASELEAVAGRIFAQFARRNILVVDVEIWEFVKRKLSFRESEDGFVIRNRKFKIDDGASLSSVEETPDEQRLLELLRDNPGVLAQLTGKAVPTQLPVSQVLPPPAISQASPVRRPIRYEVYDPAPELLSVAKQKGLNFTVKNRYPVYSEKIGKGQYDGMMYLTVDDNGVEKNVSDRFFVGPQTRLLGEGEFLEDRMRIVGGDGPEPQLAFDGASHDGMPSLRR